jgi:hypothetical protein
MYHSPPSHLVHLYGVSDKLQMTINAHKTFSNCLKMGEKWKRYVPTKFGGKKRGKKNPSYVW